MPSPTETSEDFVESDISLVRVNSRASGSFSLQDVVRVKSIDDTISETPGIAHGATFDSLGSSTNAEDVEHNHPEGSKLINISSTVGISATGDTTSIDECFEQAAPKEEKAAWADEILCVIYIGTFAILGACLRMFMARFFGLDCEDYERRSVEDFLTPFFSRICVTNSGKTEQTGGALFVDLPANMLGSWLMGLLTPIAAGHPIPWFRPDHPLQNNKIFHMALTTGFCGSLTTFASWNLQMVAMLDGTDTELGPQVASALFGYIIGVSCAVSSFLFGRHVYDWWRQIHPVPEADSLNAAVTYDDASDKIKCWERFSVFIGIRVSPFLLVAGLFAAFGVGDGVDGILFYRKMWMVSVMAPFGAVLRWKLSKWNSSPGFVKGLEWVPWGTFAANMLAVIISELADALEVRFVYPGEPSYAWTSTLLPAIESGFSGCLSTVSTFMKEIFSMKSPAQMFAYTWGSLIIAMLVGLLIYSPIVRI